jgi:segregation and condensation protein B
MAKKKQTVRTDAENNGEGPKDGAGIDLRALAERRGLISHNDVSPTVADEIEVVGLDSEDCETADSTDNSTEAQMDSEPTSDEMVEVGETMTIGDSEPDADSEPAADDAADGVETADDESESRSFKRKAELEYDPETLKRNCEAVLFRSATPVAASRIAKIIGGHATSGDVNRALKELQLDYATFKLSFEPVIIAGGWQLITRPEYGEIIERMVIRRDATKLTTTMLDTLAVIAFKQPLTRQEIDDIRGVDAGSAIRALIERGLVTMKRDDDKLGHPVVYETTTRFLEIFGVKSLSELPKATDFRRMDS